MSTLNPTSSDWPVDRADCSHILTLTRQGEIISDLRVKSQDLHALFSKIEEQRDHCREILAHTCRVSEAIQEEISRARDEGLPRLTSISRDVALSITKYLSQQPGNTEQVETLVNAIDTALLHLDEWEKYKIAAKVEREKQIAGIVKEFWESHGCRLLECKSSLNSQIHQ